MLEVVFTMTFGERAGGSQQLLWTVLRHLDRHRIAPSVVFFEDGAFPVEVASLDIPTVVLGTGRFRSPLRGARAVLALARLLRGRRPDLIVNWFARAHLYAAPAAVLAGLSDRLVWWQHIVQRGAALDRAATLLPALAVGTSSRGAAQAQARLWPNRRTFTVHPGIESPTAGTDREAAALRRSLGLDDDCAVIGTVGRVDPVKEQARLLDALAELRRQGLAAHALIVGGPEPERGERYLMALRRQAARLQIDGAVTFTGHVADAAPYIAAMDLLVNTCPSEAFGIAIVEAMALGVPVVAVDAPGPREIVEDETSGLLARPDRESVAGAVTRVLETPALRARLREGGRRRYEAGFTAERMAGELADRLTELARREASTAPP